MGAIGRSEGFPLRGYFFLGAGGGWVVGQQWAMPRNSSAVVAVVAVAPPHENPTIGNIIQVMGQKT